LVIEISLESHQNHCAALCQRVKGKESEESLARVWKGKRRERW